MKIPVKYVDFANVFSPDLTSKLPEHIGINNHVIGLVDSNRFIRPSKLPIATFLTWVFKTSILTDLSIRAKIAIDYDGIDSGDGHSGNSDITFQVIR